MRNTALNEEMMESVDNAIEEVISERRRREAEPVVVPEPEPSTYVLPYHQLQPAAYPYRMQYPLYAPTYPHFYYPYPFAHQLAVKTLEPETVEEDMEEMDEAAAEPEPETMGVPLVTLPLQSFSSPFLTGCPSVVYNPYNSLRMAPPKSVLPDMPLEGEDEPAALRI